MSQFLRNRKGSVLISTLVLVAMISAISAGIFLSINSTDVKKAGVSFNGMVMTMMSEQISSLIENETSWKKTIDSNANLACLLAPGSSCATAGDMPFDLYLPDGTIFMSHAGGSGFDKNGFHCNSYSSGTPDSNCIYKIKLYWKCNDPAGCVSIIKPGETYAKKPRMTISMEYFFNAPNAALTGETNLTHRKVSYQRGIADGGIKALCDSISGDLLAGGMHCRINPPVNYNCKSLVSPRRHMVDTLEGGSVKCKTPLMYGDGNDNPFTCNPNSGLTGFFDDHPICDFF